MVTLNSPQPNNRENFSDLLKKLSSDEIMKSHVLKSDFPRLFGVASSNKSSEKGIFLYAHWDRSLSDDSPSVKRFYSAVSQLCHTYGLLPSNSEYANYRGGRFCSLKIALTPRQYK